MSEVTTDALNPPEVEPERMEVVSAGVNHLIWILDMTIRGRDGLHIVRDWAAANSALPLPAPRGAWHEPFVDRWKLKLTLFEHGF